MTRTLVVSTSYPAFAGDPSGHFVASEVEAALARGEQVTLVIPAAESPREAALGLRLVELPANVAFGAPGVAARLMEPGQRLKRAVGLMRFLLGARRSITRLSRAEGPFDHAALHWLVPSAVPVFPRGSARRVELLVHGGDARLLARLPRPLARGVIHLAATRASLTELRTMSQAQLDGLARLADLSRFTRRRVAPCALSLGGVPSRQEARAALDVRGELLLVVGRLVASKRAHVALTAASALAALRPVRVVVIGDGPERARLEAAFPHVEFTGALPRDRCLTWLAAADGLLSASRDEGAPSVVREARQLGVPVVSCAAGDLMRWAEIDPGIVVVP
ncbi:MAG: glycosyltransferase [Polyangiaceae bacterium]|nr:glycosyltransferase [Polyangiaceae bacterium]MCW5790690.1 glycosyltransferase [Polyangiaceae bacterium]